MTQNNDTILLSDKKKSRKPLFINDFRDFNFGKVWLFGYNATIFRETLRYMANLCSIAGKSLHEKGKSWHEKGYSLHDMPIHLCTISRMFLFWNNKAS